MSKDRIPAFLTVAVTLLVCSQAFAQATDYDRRQRTASVSGRVTLEGKPAANITVTVKEIDSETTEARMFSLGGRDFVDHRFYKATTDAEGSYQITGLPAGQYVISPDAPAYAPEGRLFGSDASIKITLDEGEAREKVDFKLIRCGVITGRVTDEDGRPEIGRGVRLAELVGQDQLREVTDIRARGTESETDDRGVYRIFGIRRGRYVVMAGGENDYLRHASKARKTQLTYHPDVVKQEEAKVIEVTEGKEVTGVDIRLRNPVESFAVSGRVINAETGKPVPQARVACFPVEDPEDESGNWAADTITDSEGNFTATGLKPGKYKARYNPPQEGGDYYGEGKYFEVSDGDVSGVEVRVKRGAIINGMVIVEEGKDATTNVKLSQLSVSAQVNKEDLPSADWRVRSITQPASGAPKNNIEASRSGIAIKSGEKITGVEVLIAEDAASLRGRVVHADETQFKDSVKAPPRIQIYLLPAEESAKDDLLRYAETLAGRSGSFEFKNLAPGKYWLLARLEPETQSVEIQGKTLAWDEGERVKLRRDAKKIEVELKPCQRLDDYELRAPLR